MGSGEAHSYPNKFPHGRSQAPDHTQAFIPPIPATCDLPVLLQIDPESHIHNVVGQPYQSQGAIILGQPKPNPQQGTLRPRERQSLAKPLQPCFHFPRLPGI